MKIRPIDPATLGAVPPGKQASGNAYRVTATFQPSGASIASSGHAVTITLIYPAGGEPGVTPPPRTIMWSKDGTGWEPLTDAGLACRPAGRGLAPGTSGISSSATPPLAATSTTTSHVRLLAIIILIALAVFVLAGVLYIVRTRRREDGQER